MVEGIESFKEKFKEYTDCYTVIGGAACDILMTDFELDFRATKDIDMILVLENKYQEFAKIFWQYIKEGKYKCGWKNSENTHFYRFTDPKENGYPIMIELFSRKPDYHLEIGEGIIPIYIDEETSSLSAILLNDDFYDFMLKGRNITSDICVLGAEYLIPFKMFAWLNLIERKSKKEHVNSRDLRKHKNDVFRLLQIVENDKIIETNGLVRESIEQFLESMSKEKLNLKDLGLPFELEEALTILHKLYDIGKK